MSKTKKTKPKTKRAQKPQRPPCGHSRCSQTFIDTGNPWCVEDHDIDCDLDEDCTCRAHGSSMVTWRPT